MNMEKLTQNVLPSLSTRTNIPRDIISTNLRTYLSNARKEGDHFNKRLDIIP